MDVPTILKLGALFNFINFFIIFRFFFIIYLLYYEDKISQLVVQNALKEINTISTEETLKKINNKVYNLINIGDIQELEKEDKVENSHHIPRSMMEFWLDPENVYFRDGKFGISKEMALFCVVDLRAILSAISLKDMRFEKISHINGSFSSIKNYGFKII